MMTRRLPAPLLCVAAGVLAVPASAHAATGAIAYVADDGIHLVKADGTDDRRLTAGSEPAFSADGRTVVFAGTPVTRCSRPMDGTYCSASIPAPDPL